jgi:hypothetical protein
MHRPGNGGRSTGGAGHPSPPTGAGGKLPPFGARLGGLLAWRTRSRFAAAAVLCPADAPGYPSSSSPLRARLSPLTLPAVS